MIATEEVRYKRTWYGLTATATIGPGFLHRLGMKGFVVVHPPIVNLLLRHRLEENARHQLSFGHEFSHTESLPAALLYAGALFAAILTNGLTILKTILVLASAQAVWEFISEMISFASDMRFYLKYYDGVTIVPRVIFWVFTGALIVMGLIVAFL